MFGSNYFAQAYFGQGYSVLSASFPPGAIGTITEPSLGDLIHARSGLLSESGRGRLTRPSDGLLTKASHE